MKLNDIPDHDSRGREEVKGEYSIITGVQGSGRITCSRPGLKLIDFYVSPKPQQDTPKHENKTTV